MLHNIRRRQWQHQPNWIMNGEWEFGCLNHSHIYKRFFSFLAPELFNRLEELKRRYSDILYRWGMYRNSAEILKHCVPNDEENMLGTVRGFFPMHSFM